MSPWFLECLVSVRRTIDQQDWGRHLGVASQFQPDSAMDGLQESPLSVNGGRFRVRVAGWDFNYCVAGACESPSDPDLSSLGFGSVGMPESRHLSLEY